MAETHCRRRPPRRSVAVSFDEATLTALDHIATGWQVTTGVTWRPSDVIREAVYQFLMGTQERQPYPRA